MTLLWVCLSCPKRNALEGCEMAATSLRELEASSHTSERPLDPVGVSDLELARLLTGGTAEEHEALERFAWQTLQGAQNVRRWLWTVVWVGLVLLVVGFVLTR
jgi:hypothetical protein